MSRRINTTLTDAQWAAVVAAFALYEAELEDEGDAVDRGIADRAFRRLRDGGPR